MQFDVRIHTLVSLIRIHSQASLSVFISLLLFSWYGGCFCNFFVFLKKKKTIFNKNNFLSDSVTHLDEMYEKLGNDCT